MGFVSIFVPGTKYITCDELEQYVEESKEIYDENKEAHPNTAEARKLLKKRKFLLLDARRRDEFCVSHIYNASNVHSTFLHDKDSVKELNERLSQVCERDTLIVMYCAVGLRSAWLAKFLTSQGFTNCKVLYHGFYEWTNEGRPIYGQKCLNIQQSSTANSESCLSPIPREDTAKGSPCCRSSHVADEISVASRSQQQPEKLVEGKISRLCLCQMDPEVLHMCNNEEHGCSHTNCVAPQHYIASLALNQNLSTKYKFPSWLSDHRVIANLPLE